ncbi:MAG: hypothetical protein LIP00_11835 [Parabacteroides sp.]|nr:hypothetical protein [Parabacteroides sp.]
MKTTISMTSFSYIIHDCKICSEHAVVAVLPAKNGNFPPESYVDLLFILKIPSETDIREINKLRNKKVERELKINPVFVEYDKFRKLQSNNSLYFKNVIQDTGVLLYDNIRKASV